MLRPRILVAKRVIISMMVDICSMVEAISGKILLSDQ